MPSRTAISATVVLALSVCTAHAAPLQQPKSPANPQQAQFEKRLKELEQQLTATKAREDEVEKKADAAVLQNEYVKSIQSDAKTYYDKVLSTQTWTLSILGLIITITLFLAGRFSLKFFDARVQSSIDAAVATLDRAFNEKTQSELGTLRKENAKDLQGLDAKLTGKITDEVRKLEERSTVMALLAAAGAQLDDPTNAVDYYRLVVENIAKTPSYFEATTRQSAIRLLFITMKRANIEKFDEQAKKELATDALKKLRADVSSVISTMPALAKVLAEN